ncbi:MAG: mobilization protein, partial [Rikenellaceae bacterium]
LNRSTTREQFISKLKDTGIDVLFRVNDSGRMYGVTYIDHNNNTVLNGSRLGRELSANALTEWFDNPQQTVTPPTQTPSPQEANNLQSNMEHQSRDDEHESSLGLFDFDLAKGGDDPEEERFRRRMQRKRRKSRRL